MYSIKELQIRLELSIRCSVLCKTMRRNDPPIRMLNLVHEIKAKQHDFIYWLKGKSHPNWPKFEGRQNLNSLLEENTVNKKMEGRSNKSLGTIVVW